MRTPRAPRLDKRRTPEFSAELRERARAWLPAWGLADGERDFGRALLEIAARFSSEVAEHLDNAGEKMRRGFLDWLGVRGEAARPARVPVVFKLTDAAREAVLASAPVRMQADAAGASVVLETEKDVRVVPGRLEVVVGVDADADAFYLPPPGLSDLEPLEPLPAQWQLKSFAAAGATKLQLDPELGLAAGMILEAAGQQYRIVEVSKEIVTIEPPLTVELPEQMIARKVASFSPFDGKARNRQEHALYLGHMELLDIESEATIAITGAHILPEDVMWEYWGKTKAGEEEADWRQLTPAEKQDSDALVLNKPKGTIEPRDLDGKNSRWIRGVTKNLLATNSPFQPDSLGIRVNAVGCEGVKCENEKGPSPAAEGMANTTPLVLESTFLPLGREPRQFDAFYLGSVEAFSKKGASVQLCFQMADPSFASLSCLWGVLAGVGADRKLHLLELESGPKLEKFRDREPLQPPVPRFAVQPEQSTPIALDEKPPWRVPIWNEGFDFFVGVTAKADVWMWREQASDKNSSGWIPLGPVPSASATSAEPIDGLVYLADEQPRLAALREGKLSLLDLPSGTVWVDTPTKLGNVVIVLKSIVPVLVDNGFGQLVTSAAAGMAGISADGKLFHVATNGTCTLMIDAVVLDAGIRPVVVRDGNNIRRAVAVEKPAQGNPPRLIAFPPNLSLSTNTITLENQAKVRGPLDVVLHGGQFHFLASVTAPGTAYFAMWAPFATDKRLYKAPVPAGIGEIGGAPTLINQHVVIPGAQADVLVATFDFFLRVAANATIEPGVVLPLSAPTLSAGDLVAKLGGAEEFHTVSAGTTRDGETFYPINAAFSGAAIGPLFALRITTALQGDVTLPDQLTLQGNDQDAQLNSWLFADGMLRQITFLAGGIATVSPAFSHNTPDPLDYANALPTNGRAAPYMDLDPATTGNWDADLLKRVNLVFPDATPEEQLAKAFKVDGNNHPDLVVMEKEFTADPPGNPTFIADGTVGAWTRLLGDTSSNPELSWEYWNGTGWWKLDVKLDETLNLKNSGGVRFVVPNDIASGDWAGRTNFWIRARLIGGDYGKEQVTVITKPGPGNGEQTQAIERSSSGIRPPSVVQLRISYRLCKAVRPMFVLAQDSGSMRDQSEANKTASAVVEAFVPLARTLGRLTNPAVPDAIETGRALFIGLDAPLSGAPVNVLLLVEEAPGHEQFAPMRIEALVADRFLPVVADDATRALGESGVLSMSFALEPTPRELFGVDNLTWLRLTPGGSGPVSEWNPALRGAYLNAVWASAAETLTRELLGSSEGAPDLTVHLARPPVLRDSLELRVKEPLGEEERSALLQEGEDRVLSAVDGLPGDWVLWRPVVDPGDEPATARVYALDEASGEIRFGDGRHGAIPPIGRDSIVAFSYRRTELGTSEGGDVPANAIAARAALNLVSPVESVEEVFAADQAAGGAPPETAERVLRFGTARLRHRNRALTARDFEDLALQSSPDVVQARCFARQGQARLVVVMRGKDPLPNAAEIRELRRLLLAAAPAALSAPRALRITAPRIRHLRMLLKPRVASLDHAGEVSRAVELRLKALFDTATGGAAGEGWALGENPSEEDVALALIDTRRLEGLARVTLLEVLPDGSERPWTGAVKRDELAMLDDDAVRFEFEVVEVIS